MPKIWRSPTRVTPIATRVAPLSLLLGENRCLTGVATGWQTERGRDLGDQYGGATGAGSGDQRAVSNGVGG